MRWFSMAAMSGCALCATPGATDAGTLHGTSPPQGVGATLLPIAPSFDAWSHPTARPSASSRNSWTGLASVSGRSSKQWWGLARQLLNHKPKSSSVPRLKRARVNGSWTLTVNPCRWLLAFPRNSVCVRLNSMSSRQSLRPILAKRSFRRLRRHVPSRF